MDENKHKLGFMSLVAMVVGAMLGGAIYQLPQNMAKEASVGAILIAWLITGTGMWFIASTFSTLATIKPEIDNGLYGYAEHGFGRFTGFQVAWGYWISNICSNVGYAILLMNAVDYFFPGYFTGGNNLASIVVASTIIWLICLAVSCGMKQAAFMNNLGTIGKIIPLVVFLACLVYAFDLHTFTTDFWGHKVIPDLLDENLGGLYGQIRSTMLVTLWIFLGIEGAVLIAGQARNPQDVGKATVVGFLGILLLNMLVSILPFGTLSQGELAALSVPSTGPVLAHVVGEWGNVFMNVGVVIAILSSWLVWTVMLASMPYEAAKAGTFPKFFAKENSKGAPLYSLVASTAAMQVCLIVVYFAKDAWNVMLSITGVMILPCYLVCTLYLLRLSAVEKNYPAEASVSISKALFTAIAGTAYACWLIFAAGLQYFLVAMVIYALGIPVFRLARNEAHDGKRPFEYHEWVLSRVLVVGAVGGGIYLMMNFRRLFIGG